MFPSSGRPGIPAGLAHRSAGLEGRYGAPDDAPSQGVVGASAAGSATAVSAPSATLVTDRPASGIRTPSTRTSADQTTHSATEAPQAAHAPRASRNDHSNGPIALATLHASCVAAM